MDFPKDFSESMCRLLGQKAYERLEQALSGEPQVSIRLNTAKLATAGLNQLRSAVLDCAVPWCKSGYYLKDRPAFTFDPLFHAGAYYVQEAGSMFLEQAFEACMRLVSNGPLVALDLCAAPGGKSTHLRSLLPEGSFLISNEPMRQRAQILAENMQKWGDPACMVTNGYPAAFSSLTNFFDLIVADVPCSGEGMFRKDDGAIAEWSLENVALCRQRQRAIISDIWPALKPGGFLIYSTCTFNSSEDEENVAWIAREFDADILEVPLSSDWSVQGDLTGKGLPVYHFLPGWTRSEGFFLAVLRKKSVPDEDWEDWRTVLSRRPCKKGRAEKKKDGRNKKSAVTCALPSNWLLGQDWEWIQENGRLYAVSSSFSELCEAVRSCLPVVHCGVAVADLKGADWIPVAALALSPVCRKEMFCQVALDYNQAIAYLRKESLVLPEETPKGYVLLTYRGFPLGFVKQVGNRANNLYPDAWRIRSGHVTPCELFS